MLRIFAYIFIIAVGHTLLSLVSYWIGGKLGGAFLLTGISVELQVNAIFPVMLYLLIFAEIIVGEAQGFAKCYFALVIFFTFGATFCGWNIGFDGVISRFNQISTNWFGYSIDNFNSFAIASFFCGLCIGLPGAIATAHFVKRSAL